MSAPAYYNEIDSFAAQHLRNLIVAGHIAPGDVDERDIQDVRPDDIRGYVQCHFFAGVGVWSSALRLAGWPDDRPVWTGSCPCQPFSAAGKGTGFADERHLWPAFFHLISERRPAIILGEQVASKDAGPWIDLVHADLEAVGYAFGCVPFPSAGVGAPHIRDRSYWVADATDARLNGRRTSKARNGRDAARIESERLCAADGLANADNDGRQPGRFATSTARHGDSANANGCADRIEPAGPTNGYWRDADWLFCRDGKWRPVEPGTFPLAHGATSRVGRLRAYGNAINREAARTFIECIDQGAAQ